ncbi:MAG: HEPN domain-containing protein, partial [Candidatus Bathyarchaeia archaeon]
MTMAHLPEFVRASLGRTDKALLAAKSLLEKSLLEDSVSRAYYAMSHAAQAILYTKGLKARSHAGVKSLFGEHIVKKGVIDEEFGKAFSRAFDLRQKSDYEVQAEFKIEDVEEIIKEA